MAGLSLGPLIEPGSIHDDLTVWRQFHVRAIHRTRRRPLKVDTFTVVAAPVAGTLELVLAGLPIGCTAQVSAASVDDEYTIRRAVHPDAVFLLKLGIYAKRVVGCLADFEYGWRLKESARKKESEEGNEPSAEKSCDAAPD